MNQEIKWVDRHWKAIAGLVWSLAGVNLIAWLPIDHTLKSTLLATVTPALTAAGVHMAPANQSPAKTVEDFVMSTFPTGTDAIDPDGASPDPVPSPPEVLAPVAAVVADLTPPA